jgi:hypothetical protein
MTLIPELRVALENAPLQHRTVPRSASWRRRPRLLLTGGSAAVAAALAALILIVSASSSTPPAYALTRHADGTVTLRLYDLSRDIPQLNARLASLGISETVVPMRKGCKYGAPIYPEPGQDAITLRPHHFDLAPGYQGFLAAERLANGRVAYGQGALRPSEIPPCFAPPAHY